MEKMLISVGLLFSKFVLCIRLKAVNSNSNISNKAFLFLYTFQTKAFNF